MKKRKILPVSHQRAGHTVEGCEVAFYKVLHKMLIIGYTTMRGSKQTEQKYLGVKAGLNST